MWFEEEEFYGNLNDHEFPQDIENFDFDILEGELIQDSDGDYYFEKKASGSEEECDRVYLIISWYEIHKCSCPCCNRKFISVVDKNTAEFYRNNTDYCLSCGYPQGVIEWETLSSQNEIESAIEDGCELSERNKEILKKIYPFLLEE